MSRAARLLALSLPLAACGSGQGSHELTVQWLSLPATLDPLHETRLASKVILFNVCDPLVRVDDQGRLQPALAETWSSPTPEVYAFRLRPGLRFHDGRALGATDVVQSLERARGAGSLLAGPLSGVVRIEARDARTVEIETRAPSAALPYDLTGLPIYRDGPGPGGLVGSGPYVLEAFESERRVVLRRFERLGSALPPLERVVFLAPEDDAGVAARIERGERVALLAPGQAALAAARRSRTHLVLSQVTGAVYFLGLRLSPAPERGRAAAPFADLRVRQALAAALDLPRLDLGAAYLRTRPAAQLLPPGVFGSDPALTAARQDLARARALLTEAGLPHGFESPLDVPVTWERLTRLVVEQAARAGIRFRPRGHPTAELRRVIDQGSPAYLHTWNVGYESGSALRDFFHTADVGRALGVRNSSGYSSAEVDNLLDQALATLQPGIRGQLLKRASQRLIGDLPWIPLFETRALRIYPREAWFRPRLDGLLVLSEARSEPPPPELLAQP